MRDSISTPPQVDLSRDDDGGAVSPLSQALNAYQGRLFHVEYDLPHPVVMHGQAVRAFDRAMGALIVSASNAASRGGLDPKLSADFELVERWQEAIFRATELFDTYCQHLPKSLGAKDHKEVRRRMEPLVAAAKARRSLWAQLCNRIKHNHHVLTPHRTRYESGRTVDGYRVSKHEPGKALRAASEFHSQVPAISFGASVRELLNEVLRTEQTAAKMVGLSEGPGASILSTSLSALPSLERWPNPYERGQRSSVELVLGGYKLTRISLPTINEPAQMSAVFHGDGFTTSFDLP